MSHSLVPATFTDIIDVCGRLDDEQFSEAASVGLRDRLALAFYVQDAASLSTYVWRYGEDALGLVGVGMSSEEGVGHPWALLTPESRRHRKVLVSRAQEAMKFLCEAHKLDLLWNTKASDRVPELRWLRRIGFDLHPISVVNGNTTIFTWRNT